MSERKSMGIAVACMLGYAVIVSLGLTLGKWGAAFADRSIALLCFVTAIWYVYIYRRHATSPLDWGLLVMAAGWLAVGIAFVCTGVNSRMLWSWLGILGMVMGGVTGMLSLKSRSEES